MRAPFTRAACGVRSLVLVGYLSLACGLVLGAKSAHASDAAVDAIVPDAAPVDGHGNGGSPLGGAGGQSDHDGGEGGAAGASHAAGGAGGASGAKTDGGVRADASYTLLTDSGSGCGCGVGFGTQHNAPPVLADGTLAIVLTRVRRRRR
jgi:hypothetical protein